MKYFLLHTLLILLTLTLAYSCSKHFDERETKVPNRYTLILSTGEGGYWSPDASGTYDKGVLMTITAVADEGYCFDRFEGSDADNEYCLNKNCILSNSCRAIITMNSDRDVWAFFLKRE